MSDQSLSSVSDSSEARVGREDFKVVAASSFGTVFEWFDFFLYGALAVVMSRNFFSGVDETTGFTLALLTFAIGLAVRPFGAVLFGSLGDLWGRKNTFVITLSLMGVSTFSVGLLPTYEQAGILAPWLLVALRMLQGLSVGGVYGGAVVYVAEHAPHHRRGLYTSWIQLTATLAMTLTLFVVFATRTAVGEAAFSEWGWRIPFLLSIFLLAVVMWIQMKLHESPVYLKMKAEGRSSPHPWKDALGKSKNLKLIMIALFGAVAGQAVIWYAAQFYVLFFMERIIKVEGAIANLLIATALLIHTPLYVFFGWLSDKIGRKPIILGACVLAALTYFPLFNALTVAANPELARASSTSPVVVVADSEDCSLLFDPLGGATFTSSCDIARSFLTQAGVPYETQSAPPGTVAELHVGGEILTSFRGDQLAPRELSDRQSAWEKSATELIAAAGYPETADTDNINIFMVIVVLVALMTFSAMVYGPIAALLAEFFPANIRYTSMSFPYHVGVGWLGGFLPAASFAIVAATGDIYSGLWYPIFFAMLTFVVGLIFLPETKDKSMHE